MKVSQLIKVEEIRKWNTGDIITITAGTGAGKSYFIKSILYAFAKLNNKKILMLIHRRDCINQFQAEIEQDHKTDVIEIKSYQKIEWNNMQKIHNDLSKYQYIVCDEFHYFMSDAAFNKTTDISLNEILDSSNNIKIFMSATGSYVKNYLNNVKELKTIDYELKTNYNFIKSLTFFNKDKTMEEFINDSIKTGEKAIFFIQSCKKAYNLYKRYKDYCLFNCSKNNKEYYKYVDNKEITKMLQEQKFDKNILITTLAMDTGVNIIDADVKHIVCDVEDIAEIIQCIGRKRIKYDTEYIYLYIHQINNCMLGGKVTQLQNKIKMADYLKEHTVKEYLDKFPRTNDYSNIVYDNKVDEDNKCTKKINELMYFKCKIDLFNIQTMLSMGNYGYCKIIKNLLGIKKYRLIEEEENQDKLENYLNSIIGKKLFNNEQKELKEVFNNNGLSARTLGINTLNGYLLDCQLPYLIKSERSSKRINGIIKTNRFWRVYQTVCQKMQKAI